MHMHIWCVMVTTATHWLTSFAWKQVWKWWRGCVKRCVAHILHMYTYISLTSSSTYNTSDESDVSWLNCLPMHWLMHPTYSLTHSYGTYILTPLCLHASRYICMYNTYIHIYHTNTLWWYIKVQKKKLLWFDVTFRRSMTASFISVYVDLRFHPLNIRSSNHPAPLLTMIQYQ